MQARYVILNVLREAGENFVTIEKTEDGPIVRLDRTKIATVGNKAIGEFLKKINGLQSNCKCGGRHCNVQQIFRCKFRVFGTPKNCSGKKQPRKVFIQPHTYILDGTVHLKTFEPSAKGLVDSFVTRFGPTH